MDLSALAFDDRGLVPCVIQDADSGEVLTLAYANMESLQATQRTGELHLWSRSRDELWHKGATSGNTQQVVGLRADCDADAVLALVRPAGPACHTGERTCFHTGDIGTPAGFEVLPDLERTVSDRAARLASGEAGGSYVAELLADPPHIGEKVQEEAEEVARAAREETDDRIANEAADVLFHLTVLLHSRGLGLADALDVLRERRRPATGAGPAS